jgi:hypothetical protein
MGSTGPIQIVILSVIALLLLGGYGQIVARRRARAGVKPGGGFFRGMNATTCLALTGAMLLALALLIDVYGSDWTPAGLGDDLSLGLAGSGGILTLLSLFLDRRSRRRG